MPLEDAEEFVAKLQKNNRVQIPVLIRWRNKLEPGEIFRVQILDEFFYARLSRDGRITIPKIVMKVLTEDQELKPGDIFDVTLYPA